MAQKVKKGEISKKMTVAEKLVRRSQWKFSKAGEPTEHF